MAWPAGGTKCPTTNSDGAGPSVKLPTTVIRYDSGIGRSYETDGPWDDDEYEHSAIWAQRGWTGFVPDPPYSSGGGGSPPPTEGQLWPRGDHTQPD